MMARWSIALGVGLLGLVPACSSPGAPLAVIDAAPAVAPAAYDPLAAARAAVEQVANLEAAVPPMCYTRTDGVSNPCWVCHTGGVGPNTLGDADLQADYAFSEVAQTNHWTNLFVDRGPFVAAVTEVEILAWVRQDNYAPLRDALAERADWRGWTPDLELAAGFDGAGFARDGSGWRAVRYVPFPGTFWPGNGSTDDVFVRLPDAFRAGVDGAPSRAIYQLNLAIVEAAIAGVVDPDRLAALDREVEPVDERLLGFDLDGDGALGARTTRIRRLPPRYAGGAAAVAVEALVLPVGTELLHSVRYLDPDAPGAMATRMKELRYLRKVEAPDAGGRLRAYEQELNEKLEGLTPRYRGDALEGYVNAFGWRVQGFIEDAAGRLRLQTDEEHRFCMGCHQGIGVTVDSTFSLARKVPGRDGWRPQDLRGLPDLPQWGHVDGELLTYFRRVGGGDETRSNDELLARWVPGGVVDEAGLRRVAPGGALDLFTALAPSRARALDLDRAYLAVVREQSFTRGRDAVLAPATRVHRRIDEASTGLGPTGRVYRDGRLHLDWRAWTSHALPASIDLP